MPGRNPYHFKSVTKRRRRYQKGLTKVKRDVKWLKKNIEFKFLDSTLNNVELSTTPVVTPLSLIADGPLVSERSGESLTARRIALRFTVENNNGTPVDCVCRIMLVRSKQPRGALLPISGLLVSSDVNSWRNLDRKNDIVVYADYTFTMDTTQHSMIPVKLIKKLNHIVKFSGAAGSNSTLQENGLFLISLSTVVTGANAPTLIGISRFSFNDS